MLHDKFPSAVKREFEIDSEEHSLVFEKWESNEKKVTPGQECDVPMVPGGGGI